MVNVAVFSDDGGATPSSPRVRTERDVTSVFGRVSGPYAAVLKRLAPTPSICHTHPCVSFHLLSVVGMKLNIPVARKDHCSQCLELSMDIVNTHDMFVCVF